MVVAITSLERVVEVRIVEVEKTMDAVKTATAIIIQIVVRIVIPNRI